MSLVAALLFFYFWFDGTVDGAQPLDFKFEGLYLKLSGI